MGWARGYWYHDLHHIIRLGYVIAHGIHPRGYTTRDTARGAHAGIVRGVFPWLLQVPLIPVA